MNKINLLLILASTLLIACSTGKKALQKGNYFSAVTKAVERLKAHEPGPFDLDIELQEEVFLQNWQLGEGEEQEREQVVHYALTGDKRCYKIQVAANDTVLRQNVTSRKLKGPLFGVMHFEMCNCVVQPLSVLMDDGPKYLCIDNKKRGAAELLKSLKF